MATHHETHPFAAGNHAVCFRVYPRPRRSRLHILVRIFGTHGAMIKGAAPYRHLLPKGFRAANIAYYRRDARNRLLPQRGEVFLCQPHLDVGSIAHEALHAALAHARDTKIDLGSLQGDQDSTSEETIAEMMDTLLSQILTGCQKFGLSVGVNRVGGN